MKIILIVVALFVFLYQTSSTPLTIEKIETLLKDGKYFYDAHNHYSGIVPWEAYPLCISETELKNTNIAYLIEKIKKSIQLDYESFEKPRPVELDGTPRTYLPLSDTSNEIPLLLATFQAYQTGKINGVEINAELKKDITKLKENIVHYVFKLVAEENDKFPNKKNPNSSKNFKLKF